MTDSSPSTRPQVADRANEIGAARGRIISDSAYAEAAGLRVDGGKREAYPSLGRKVERGEKPSRQRAANNTIKLGKPPAPKDYTPHILNFLKDVHGQVRKDDHGDYFYANVSTIGLHFLLQSGIPGKEMLWQWHQYFDQEHGENIYKTLAPLEDETFLTILDRCDFHWNRDAVRESGFLFLSEHHHKVHLSLAEFVAMRIDGLWIQEESELKTQLSRPMPTEQCLIAVVDELRTSPLAHPQRLAIYEILPSSYICATAKVLLDQAVTLDFWKNQLAVFDPLEKRITRLKRELRNAANRLGVYYSAEDFAQQRRLEEERKRHEQQQQRRRLEEERRRQARQQESWERTHTQHAHQPNKPRHGTRLAKELELLGLDEYVSLDTLKQAYRQKAKALHPDQGGDVKAFLRLQQAYEFVLTTRFQAQS